MDENKDKIICWGHPNLQNPVLRNMYFKQLYNALSGNNVECRCGYFNLWFSKFDLIHIQFPQQIGFHRNILLSTLKAILLLGGILIARMRGKPVVWTMHNTAPHDPAKWPWLAAVCWRTFQRIATGSIYLTEGGRRIAVEKYPSVVQRAYAVIPHGHYCAVSGTLDDKAASKKRLGYSESDRIFAYLGGIRPYKGCVDLVRAFNGIEDSLNLNLIVCGPCVPSEQRKLESLSGQNSHILLNFAKTDDDAFRQVLAVSDLVVLPYRDILNSGSVFHTLSLARPVCAPRLGALPEVQQIVGSDWLYLYDPPLRADILLDAMSWAINTHRTSPDLSYFDWGKIGKMHREFYESQLGLPKKAIA
ncbi:MAG: glycosyltransferase family 4 protein [Formivibrio sp.]|nr:glycosyltransferase family 4 protein [Formivibrio sp.]